MSAVVACCVVQARCCSAAGRGLVSCSEAINIAATLHNTVREGSIYFRLSGHVIDIIDIVDIVDMVGLG